MSKSISDLTEKKYENFIIEIDKLINIKKKVFKLHSQNQPAF